MQKKTKKKKSQSSKRIKMCRGQRKKKCKREWKQ